MNAGMKWIQEWNGIEAWKWIQEWNKYRNETECSLDGNEGTNQCIIKCTKQNAWMNNLCTNTYSSELPKGSNW